MPYNQCEEFNSVPIASKYALTIAETAKYTNIGKDKLYDISRNNKDAQFLLKIGNKTLFKRDAFVKYLDTVSSL